MLSFPWFIPCLCNPSVNQVSCFIIAWFVWQKSQDYKSPAGLSVEPIFAVYCGVPQFAGHPCIVENLNKRTVVRSLYSKQYCVICVIQFIDHKRTEICVSLSSVTPNCWNIGATKSVIVTKDSSQNQNIKFQDHEIKLLKNHWNQQWKQQKSVSLIKILKQN